MPDAARGERPARVAEAAPRSGSHSQQPYGRGDRPAAQAAENRSLFRKVIANSDKNAATKKRGKKEKLVGNPAW